MPVLMCGDQPMRVTNLPSYRVLIMKKISNILLLTIPIADEFENQLVPIMMDKTRSHPPTGVYLLAKILKNRGIPFNFIDLIAAGTIEDEFIDREYEVADIIALPANSLNWPTATRVIRRIRELNPDALIILGNIHGTLFPRHIVENHPVDYVLRGEAESTLPTLIEALICGRDPTAIPGLCYKRDGQIHIGAEIPILSEAELERNPVPLWEIMPEKAYASISIESSRGCPFDCVFCSIPFRRNWRKLEARRFIELYKATAAYTSRARTDIVSITDDCFTINKKRVHEITSYLAAEGLTPVFSFDARASEICDDTLCADISPYTSAILIGAEAGYEEGLKKVGKKVTLVQFIKAAQNVKKHGIAQNTVFSFILGFPWETYNDVLKTVNFAFELYAIYGVQIYLQWHNLIPGSQIWYGFERSGRLSIDEYDRLGFFRNRKLMSLGHGCTQEEILDICDRVLSLQKLAKIKGIIDGRTKDAVSFSVPWYLQKDYMSHLKQGCTQHI
jgi:radical SAM superfamily enzyme YgiQ (UPF0313 family)